MCNPSYQVGPMIIWTILFEMLRLTGPKHPVLLTLIAFLSMLMTGPQAATAEKRHGLSPAVTQQSRHNSEIHEPVHETPPQPRMASATSRMQVHISPSSGRPIPADHPERVADTISPVRAKTLAPKNPPAVFTNTRENGGKVIITGPYFRTHRQAGVSDGKVFALCTASGETTTSITSDHTDRQHLEHANFKQHKNDQPAHPKSH